MKKFILFKASILSAVLVTFVAIQPLNAAENVIRDYTLHNLESITEIKAKIKAMDGDDPYGAAVEKALDLVKKEEANKTYQANKATELAQNAEVAKAMRAQQAKSKSRSDSILHLDSNFSLFIRSLLDYRNRLTICPHMDGRRILPYAYIADGSTFWHNTTYPKVINTIYITAEEQAAALQLAAFNMTALLSRLKADLDAPKPDRIKIIRSFNTILQQAKDMTTLIRLTEEKSYASINKQAIEKMDDGLQTVKNAMNAAKAIKDANEQDKAIGKLFETFLGGLAAIGVQAAGTAAGDPMVGMTAGSAATEFGSSVGMVISGPIIKDRAIQRQNQQLGRYGSYGAFNEDQLNLLATSMELGKQFFKELWITQWEQTADSLVKDCIEYCNSLRSEVASKLQNLTIAPEVDDRATAINNVFVDILAKVQNVLDDISTVSDIATDESLANSSSAFNILLGDTAKTAALQAAVSSLQARVTGGRGLNSLLNALFKNWQSFQTASGDIESIKGAYDISEPNTADDQKKLEDAIAAITGTKSKISAISSYLSDTLYPNTLKTFSGVADSLRKMANDEIKNANMALVKVAPLIVGDMVTNEQNLLMVLSTNTLSVSLATKWAQAMREAHEQYKENLSLDSLSLVIQYAFSTDTDGRTRSFGYMTKSYPQFAALGDYKIIAPMLSARISNSFSLLSRLPAMETDVSDTVAQMKVDLDNLNSWIDDYVEDAKDYLNT